MTAELQQTTLELMLDNKVVFSVKEALKLIDKMDYIIKAKAKPWN